MRLTAGFQSSLFCQHALEEGFARSSWSLPLSGAIKALPVAMSETTESFGMIVSEYPVGNYA